MLIETVRRDSNCFVKLNKFKVAECFPPHIKCTKWDSSRPLVPMQPSWQPYLSVFLSSSHSLLPTNNGTLESQNHHCPTGLSLDRSWLWPRPLVLPRDWSSLTHIPERTQCCPCPFLIFCSCLGYRQRGTKKKKNVSGGYWLSDIAMVMEVTTVSKGDRLAHGVSQRSLRRPWSDQTSS